MSPSGPLIGDRAWRPSRFANPADLSPLLQRGGPPFRRALWGLRSRRSKEAVAPWRDLPTVPSFEDH
jgi:hypothetical protein